MLAPGQRRILAVSPHSDDVELGCSGFLARELDSGSVVHVLVAVLREENMQHCGKVPAHVRQQEFWAAMECLGVDELRRHMVHTHQPETFDLCVVPKVQLIAKLDVIIRAGNITTVLIPVPSFHQEHQYVYECGIAATRPTKFQSTVREVFAYEYPAANWGPSSSFDAGKGGVYVNIDKYLDKKIKVVSKHKSQCYREEQSMISMEAVKQMARFRGIEAGCKYAELMYLLRAVV